MRLTPLDEGKRWLDQANEDLKWAKDLATRGGYHIACFLAQFDAGLSLCHDVLMGYIKVKAKLSNLRQPSLKAELELLNSKNKLPRYQRGA